MDPIDVNLLVERVNVPSGEEAHVCPYGDPTNGAIYGG